MIVVLTEDTPYPDDNVCPRSGAWNSADDPFYRTWDSSHLFQPPTDPPRPEWEPLARLLSPVQWTALVRTGGCDLQGSGGGWYRFRLEGSGNLYRHTDRVRICLAHPSRYAPLPVVFAAQVWLLTHDEPEYLRRAHVLGVVDMLPVGIHTAPGYLPIAGRAYTVAQYDADRARPMYAAGAEDP